MPAQIKSAKSNASIAVIGIDIGKNVFHLVGLDRRGPSSSKRSSRATSLRTGLPIRRPASSAWRGVLAHIT